MPIDPNIAAGVKPIEIENPLEQYARVLQIQGAQQANSLNRYKIDDEEREITNRNALNAAYKAATDPSTGDVDYSKLLGSLASQDMGSAIPGVQKSQMDYQKGLLDNKNTQADIIKKTYDGMKTYGETIKERTEFFHQRLNGVTTPEQYKDVQRQTHADPVLGPYLDSIGSTYDKGVATVDAAVKSGKFGDFLLRSQIGAKDASEQQFHVINTGGEIKLVATDKYGRSAPRVIRSEKVTLNPNRPVNKTTVQNNITTVMPKDLSKSLSPKAAEDISNLRSLAEGADQRIADKDAILGIVNTPGKAWVGPGAHVKLKAAQALVATGVAPRDIVEKVERTQLLDKYLSNNIWNKFSQLKASGVSMPRLTNYELQLMSKSTAGDISMSPGAIRAIVSIDRKIDQASVDHYNNRLKSLDPEVLPYYGFTPVGSTSKPTSGNKFEKFRKVK